MVIPYLVFIGLLTIERVVELVISRRHLAWAVERGGVVAGGRHFGFMKALHTAFLLSCPGEVLLLDRSFHPELGVPMLTLALAAQGLRYWAIFTLGPFWNVQVIVVPGTQPITRGPYRYLRPPHYLAGIVEGFAVPLIYTAWITATAFSLLNAALLRTRIRCEEEALATHCRYRERFGHLPRLLPGRASHRQP